MPLYACDDQNILRCLKKLEEQIVSSGGWLHEKLEIGEEGGDLSVFSPLEPEDRTGLLINLPEQALVPYEAGWVGIRNDEFYLKENVESPLLTPQRRMLLETILELYNLTGKVEAHRKRSVYFACGKDSESFRRLTAARRNMPTLELLRKAKEVNAVDDFLSDSFFQSRILALPKGVGVKSYNVVMPFIDFANHHPDAEPFKSNTGRLGLLNCRIVPGSRECFARYGPYDAYDVFMGYGYAERSTRFVRSVPLTIALEGLGEITTDANVGRVKSRELPFAVKDLEFYLPTITNSKTGRIVTSFLIIPGSMAPRALRRVLAVLIDALGAPRDRKKRLAYIEDAEYQIIAKNIEFYEDLRNFLEALNREARKPIHDVAAAVVERQLALIGEYADRIRRLFPAC